MWPRAALHHKKCKFFAIGMGAEWGGDDITLVVQSSPPHSVPRPLIDT